MIVPKTLNQIYETCQRFHADGRNLQQLVLPLNTVDRIAQAMNLTHSELAMLILEQAGCEILIETERGLPPQNIIRVNWLNMRDRIARKSPPMLEQSIAGVG
jgi:hypothetical protein